jgi:hypothetical protein
MLTSPTLSRDRQGAGICVFLRSLYKCAASWTADFNPRGVSTPLFGCKAKALRGLEAGRPPLFPEFLKRLHDQLHIPDYAAPGNHISTLAYNEDRRCHDLS